MSLDGILIYLVCFRRSLVHAGTLLTTLDYLDRKGQDRAYVCGIKLKDEN